MRPAAVLSTLTSATADTRGACYPQVFVPESKEVVEDEDRFSWQEVPLVRAFWVLLVLTTGEVCCSAGKAKRRGMHPALHLLAQRLLNCLHTWDHSFSVLLQGLQTAQ